eukprot:Gb_14147 [translate_table: standard]
MMPKMYHLLLVIVIPLSDSVFAFVHSFNPNLSNASDQHSLLQFKATLTGDPYNSLGNWTPDLAFCNWTGVTCSLVKQRVVCLNLTGKGLEGFISLHLGNLSSLTVLDLSKNALNGPIPPQLGYLLDLQVLKLGKNRLKGSIPNELGFLQDLKVFRMGMNDLTGTNPPSLANISTLIDLFLKENNLHGRIPVELSMFKQLSILQVRQNQLVGSIPIALSNCTALWALSLSNNQLRGQIPLEFGAKLTNMQELYLWGNHLTGSIPLSLANCSRLTQLQIEKNQLSGLISTELGNLLFLERLYLNDNQFVSGSSSSLPFLTAITNCSSLQQLRFHSNHLTGVLPVSVAHLSTKLSVLSIGNNRIRGNIPPQIGNLTNLALLKLNNNLLGGNIPLAFKGLEKLERLNMSNNKLQGSIPREIGELKRLGELSLDQNMLSGQIPDSFGNLQQLRYLYLNQNQLSGKIPASLSNCSVLENLDLSYNKLSGTLPPQVASLPNLIGYLNLSSNSLQGSLPFEIGKLTRVEAIDLSVNHFSGVIPNTLESCVELRYLNISGNAFDGPIPLSFQNLISLENMDLSSNNLSGTIPAKSLAKLKMLQHLNFSFNNFTGEVPEEGIFKNLSAASFKGNPGLCGPRIHLRNCRRPLMVKDVALKVGHRRVSYAELVHATDNFSDNNLVGVGSFGSVYKGILNDGTMAAVKILSLQNEEANKSFTRECRVLSRVRHRNLVGIITSFSNNEFKALVLPFMSNGSLEKQLYPRGNDTNAEQSARGLNLKERLNIAHGIEYLHHDSSNQIVHCDLKPANVLLDDDMTAHVSDFGIASLVFANSSTQDAFSSALTLKGSVGYIAPEYGLGGRTSTKGDVYSYGIVVLELVTGNKPTSDMFEGELNLHKWVSMAFPQRVEEIIDKCLLRDMRDEGMEEDEIYNCLNPFIYGMKTSGGTVATSPLMASSGIEALLGSGTARDGRASYSQTSSTS